MGIQKYKLVYIIQLLISRLNHPNPDCVNLLLYALTLIALEYPEQSIWWLLPMKYFLYSKRNPTTISSTSAGIYGANVSNNTSSNSTQNGNGAKSSHAN